VRERQLCARGCSESALAPVVHGDRTIPERLRRDQLQLSRTGQPALVQGRAVASDRGRLRPPFSLDPSEVPFCCNPATSFTYDPAKIVGLGAALNGAGCLLRLELAPRRAWFGPR
jgi:hypothetical protein